MPGRKPLAQPRDVIYHYDGTLYGFFCCVFESVYGHEIPAEIYPLHQAQPSLFPHVSIQSDHEKARRVEHAIKTKLTPAALELIETVFFSCMAQKELHMLRFLLKAFEEGPQVLNMLGDPLVAPLLKAQQHLLGERHLLLGFIRFAEHEGILFATITPKNFILPFIADHFCQRYSNETFMIYDKAHKSALLHRHGHHEIFALEHLDYPKADESELGYQRLWKQFYNTIAIEARTNPKCRMTHMPKRYWENMLELQDQLH